MVRKPGGSRDNDVQRERTHHQGLVTAEAQLGSVHGAEGGGHSCLTEAQQLHKSTSSPPITALSDEQMNSLDIKSLRLCVFVLVQQPLDVWLKMSRDSVN